MSVLCHTQLCHTRPLTLSFPRQIIKKDSVLKLYLCFSWSHTAGQGSVIPKEQNSPTASCFHRHDSLKSWRTLPLFTRQKQHSCAQTAEVWSHRAKGLPAFIPMYQMFMGKLHYDFYAPFREQWCPYWTITSKATVMKSPHNSQSSVLIAQGRFEGKSHLRANNFDRLLFHSFFFWYKENLKQNRGLLFMLKYWILFHWEKK